MPKITSTRDAEPLELMIQFLGESAPRVPKEEYESGVQELAVAIAQTGQQGVDSLLAFAPFADELRLRALLLALTLVREDLTEPQREQLCDLALRHLADKRPLIVAEAVDTLRHLVCRRAKELVAALSRHPSPYVRGSVLRYYARRHPKEAVPLLEKALNSRDPIIRQNAVDELDEMNHAPALAKIKRLLADSDEDVRQAARTAVEHLSNGLE